MKGENYGHMEFSVYRHRRRCYYRRSDYEKTVVVAQKRKTSSTRDNLCL